MMATNRAQIVGELTEGLPPMLQLYREFKSRYPDHLLFFQVGDFYELFFEDAVTVARYLNITLTSRDKRSDNPIPMCGVPLAVIDGYLNRLLDGGFSAAVVSQVEGTENRKGGAERRLERIVTPSIRVLAGEDGAGAQVGVLVSVITDENCLFQVASTQVEAGEILILENVHENELVQKIASLCPTEIVLSEEDGRRLGWVRQFDRAFGEKTLRFRLVPERGDLLSGRNFAHIPGYNGLSQSMRSSVRLLVSYVDESTVDSRLEFHSVAPFLSSGRLIIDSHSRLNLEILQNARDRSVRHTLLEYVDRTVTPGGHRLLRQWLLAPLADVSAIVARQDVVEQFLAEREQAQQLKELLQSKADLERVAARVELGVATPRELAAIRDVLEIVPRVRELSEGLLSSCSLWNQLKAGAVARYQQPLELLARSLEDNPGTLSDGGVIRSCFDERLDRFRALCADGDRWLKQFEAEQRSLTGIQSLKVKRNGVLGFFIEVTKANASKVPADYLRRQSMVNAERFTTETLRARESAITEAQSQLMFLERELFAAVREQLREQCEVLRATHQVLSTLDVLLSFALLSDQYGLVRPEIHEGEGISIRAGKHPSASQALSGQFIPNDLEFSQEKRCLILTGPNMGGKSTYLRQAAHLVVLAQIGAHVPAESASIGVVDKIFARLGASDDLSEGESTFMVEMRECSQILRAATERSLVLIDEIGRGTATEDGFCLAQAVLEWLIHQIGCKTLFATHFHEITALAETPGLAVGNLHVGSTQRGDALVFTHQILPGAANRSYGLEVAKMAELPKPLLKRAVELLQNREVQKGACPPVPQLELFRSPFQGGIGPSQGDCVVEEHELVQRLRLLSPDELTPREALELLYELHKEAKDGSER